MLVCDFCCVEPVKWRHFAKTFVDDACPVIVSVHLGDWAACDTCHGLLVLDLREALAIRSAEHLRIPTEFHTKVGMMRSLHTKFFQNYEGKFEAA